MDKTNNAIQIAIDGPAGSGKSSVAKLVASKLNILYLDTGAMYRALALYAGRNNIAGDDNDGIDRLLKSFNLEFADNKLYLNNEDITSEIRTKQIDLAVSAFAVNPFVRKKLVKLQQQIAGSRDIIMEGRDICTVVLKNAAYKFYFDASPEIRAKRRHAQNLQNNIISDYDEVYKDIIRRDNVDSSRKADPLRPAQDAFIIDTANYTLEEMAQLVISMVKAR